MSVERRRRISAVQSCAEKKNAFSGMRRLLKCISWVDFDLDDIYVLNSWKKSRTNVDFDLDNLRLEQREETKSGKN